MPTFSLIRKFWILCLADPSKSNIPSLFEAKMRCLNDKLTWVYMWWWLGLFVNREKKSDNYFDFAFAANVFPHILHMRKSYLFLGSELFILIFIHLSLIALNHWNKIKIYKRGIPQFIVERTPTVAFTRNRSENSSKQVCYVFIQIVHEEKSALFVSLD